MSFLSIWNDESSARAFTISSFFYACVSHELSLIPSLYQPDSLSMLSGHQADFLGIFFLKKIFVENGTSFVVDGDTMGFPVFVVVYAWSLGGALKRLLCVCVRAHVYSSAFAEQLCALGEGLMIHLWPSTMWHSKDWADMVLIISSHFSMHKVFLLDLGFFFLNPWGSLPSFFNSLWVSLIKESPVLTWFRARDPNDEGRWSRRFQNSHFS